MENIESGWIEPCIHTYQVENTMKNRRIFRTIARDICGESMEPTDQSIVLFGDTRQDGIKCVISGRTSEDSTTDPKDRSFYHWIDFLFVNKDFQGKGYGTILVQQMEQIMRNKQKRPIRVESAEKSVGFFQRIGYQTIGDPERSVYPGCHLFQVLNLMEKFSLQKC